MSKENVVPGGEDLRRAVRWISEQPACGVKTVEKASRRFDLSPADEEFLIRLFVKGSVD
jgi:hypothetical protein